MYICNIHMKNRSSYQFLRYLYIIDILHQHLITAISEINIIRRHLHFHIQLVPQFVHQIIWTLQNTFLNTCELLIPT